MSPVPSASLTPARIARCVLLAWLVPGAGHWALGRRGKALLYFVGITLLFVMGLFLGEFRNFHPEHFWLHFLAQVWVGGFTLPAAFFLKDLPLETAEPVREVAMGFSGLDVGVLYTAVAGLLNLCVMVDVYETACPRPEAPAGAARAEVRS